MEWKLLCLSTYTRATLICIPQHVTNAWEDSQKVSVESQKVVQLGHMLQCILFNYPSLFISHYSEDLGALYTNQLIQLNLRKTVMLEYSAPD